MIKSPQHPADRQARSQQQHCRQVMNPVEQMVDRISGAGERSGHPAIFQRRNAGRRHHERDHAQDGTRKNRMLQKRCMNWFSVFTR